MLLHLSFNFIEFGY